MTDTPQSAAPRRLFTATLVLGVSGTGKTSLLQTYAEYLWETYQQILLLYSWDGGAIPTGVQRRMKQGLIRFWRARTRSAEGLGLETMYLATKGYWPKEINPTTGEVSPAVELVAPVTTKYTLSCPQGHLLKVVPFASLIVPTFCPECRQQIEVAKLRVQEEMKRTAGFEQVGGVAYDGLTAMCDVVMEQMDHMRGSGHIGGEKSAFGGVVKSGGKNFGGNNRADYGFAQSRAKEFVSNSLSIPFLVEGPIFTALAAEVEESNLTVVGPKLAGSALVDAASAWFGNVMETAKVPNADGKECHTLFTKPYIDASNRRHLLKTSASPGAMPDALVDPIDAPFSQFNLGNVFRLLDADLARMMGEERPLVVAPVQYGEAVTVERPVPIAPSGQGPASSSLASASAGPSRTGGGVTAPPPVAGPRPRAAAPRATAPAPAAPAPSASPAPATPPLTPAAPAEPSAEAASAAPVVVQPPGRTPPPPGMKPPQRAPGS